MFGRFGLWYLFRWMDKKKLLKEFETQVSNDLAVITQAAVVAHEAATHTESKAEDQYDTRGLEASYLAEAQSKRAQELEELLAIYRHVDIKSFTENTPIASTAVVALKSDDQDFYYLLMPKGGGMQAKFEGKVIHVITPQSPLGSALLGQKVGNEISVEIKRATRDYEIVSVW